MKTSFFKQVLLLLIMCSISCTPVDGEMGPQGPAGENGKDGNVNIISSGWITNPAFGNKGLGTSFPISDKKPYFNEDLRDNGLVMVYGKLKNSNYVKALATVILRRMIYSFDISDQTINIGISSTNTYEMTYNNFSHFRYVIIPADNEKTNAKEFIKKMSYKQVMDFLTLEVYIWHLYFQQ